MSLARDGAADLVAASEALARGEGSALRYLERSLDAADGPACRQAFLRRFDGAARATAQALDNQRAAGVPMPPLAGLAVSVKDLFDVAGQPTTAASKAMSGAAPAATDCTAVRRLRAAGAALVGHTNLSEFAFSGVGLNPSHGTPVNAATFAIDGLLRVPGGSTSGGATSVAAGAAFAALGSDTGGSIRIPAALQGLVGFKNTQRLTPLDGSVPLSTSLDTSCAITCSVRDAVLLHEVLAARQVVRAPRPVRQWRLAVPTTVMLDGLEPAVALAFDGVLKRLRDAGMAIDEIALAPIGELAAINARGGLPAAESWHWHRERLATRASQYDPRVAMRIRRGEALSAADYIELLQARQTWIATVERQLAGYDACLSPTVPMVAPPVEPLLLDDDAFFATNARLLRNTAVVNFLDGCAISLPCQEPGALPIGLMAWAPAMRDDSLLELALAIEALMPAAGR